MTSEQERWDAKHTAAAAQGLQPPNTFLVRVLDELGLPEGTRALDLAAGRGRQSVELLRRGFDVEAWDISPRGLELIESNVGEVRTRCVDLSARPLPACLFDLVVIVDFLDRDLHEELQQLVLPGGHAIVTTFTTQRSGQRPSAAYCLEPGELELGIAGFECVLAMETIGRAGWSGRRVLSL